jgi:hypothetical protein
MARSHANSPRATLLLAGAIFAAIALSAGAQPTTTPASPSQVAVPADTRLPITFDGHVSKFEYADAAHVTFPNAHGTVDAFIKTHDNFLCFAFQIPDLTPFMGDDIVTMLDLKNAKDPAPTPSDIRAYVRRKIENSRMHEGKDSKWAETYGDWEWRTSLYSTGWEVETRIPLKSLHLEPGKPATLGLAFRIWDNEPQKVWNWPAGSNEEKPSTWGTLTLP